MRADTKKKNAQNTAAPQDTNPNPKANPNRDPALPMSTLAGKKSGVLFCFEKKWSIPDFHIVS